MTKPDPMTRQRLVDGIVREFNRKRQHAKRQKKHRASLFASSPDLIPSSA